LIFACFLPIAPEMICTDKERTKPWQFLSKENLPIKNKYSNHSMAMLLLFQDKFLEMK